jgi:TP901 family phage tail tape measure protein
MAGPGAVIASLLIKLGLDPSGVTTGVKQAQGSLGSLSSKANMATAAAGAAIGNFAVSAMGDFQRFDDRMREIFSIMPGISAETMAKMEKDIRDTSKSMGLNAEEVASGVYDAISSGIDPTQVTEFIQVASKAAVAGVSDAKSASKVLASTLNAYSMDASQATEVADILFQTVKVGVTTFPELAAEMANISPVASVMGVDLTQTTAALAAMTLQGHNTASASTDIAAVFTLLQKTTPELREVLTEAGYASGQAALDALGFQGTLEMLRDTADRLGIAIPKMTGRVQAAQAIFALTGDKAEGAREVLDSYGDAAGSVDYAFEVMESGIGGTVRRLQATLQDLSITVGETLSPIAPLFLAFGPQMGRLLGSGIGAGLALGMKGIGAIARRALPGLTATLTEMGAEAGGGMARGLGTSISTAIKSAGWRKLAFGGLAVAAGMAISSGAAGDFGGLEKVAGAALTIGGAFAIGGPVLAGIAAFTLAVSELMGLFSKMAAQQAELDAQVAGIAEGTGEAALTGLATMTKYMNEVQGFNRVLGDTVGGKQQVDTLVATTARIAALREGEALSYEKLAAAVIVGTQAAAEARARGNEDAAKSIEANVQMIEAMRDEAESATDGLYHGIVVATEAGAAEVVEATEDAGAAAGAAVTRVLDQFKTRLSEGATAISSAWDTLTGAIEKGPKIMSLAKRMETARKAIAYNVKQLRKAIAARDVVSAAAYADRLVQSRQAVRDIRGPAADATMDRARTVLANSRRINARQHKGMADDAIRETERGAKGVKQNAEKAARATPDAMRAHHSETVQNAERVGAALPDALESSAPKVAAAAGRAAAAVTSPLASVASQSMTWGQRIGGNLASGLAAMVPAVALASARLAAAAAGPIESHSPPRIGPLRNIGKWGPRLIEAWLAPMGRNISVVERMGMRLGSALQPRPLIPARIQAHDIDRLRVTRSRDVDVSGRARYSEVHFHIGTLIADDKGLDELDKRITRRRRMRDRGPMRYSERND